MTKPNLSMIAIAALIAGLVAGDASAAQIIKRVRRGNVVKTYYKDDNGRLRVRTRRIADKSSANKFEPSWSLKYAGDLQGPSLGDINSKHPDSNGNAVEEIHIKNDLKLSYQAAKAISLYVTPRWVHQISGIQKFSISNPKLGVHNGDIFTSGRFNTSGGIYAYLPVTESSQDRGVILSPGTYIGLSQGLGETNMTFDLSTGIHSNLLKSSGTGTDLEIWAAPALAYKISPKVSTSLTYEVGGSHTSGTPLTPFTNEGMKLTLGVGWQVSDTVNLNPYLAAYPDKAVDENSTTLGGILSARVF